MHRGSAWRLETPCRCVATTRLSRPGATKHSVLRLLYADAVSHLPLLPTPVLTTSSLPALFVFAAMCPRNSSS